MKVGLDKPIRTSSLTSEFYYNVTSNVWIYFYLYNKLVYDKICAKIAFVLYSGFRIWSTNIKVFYFFYLNFIYANVINVTEKLFRSKRCRFEKLIKCLHFDEMNCDFLSLFIKQHQRHTILMYLIVEYPGFASQKFIPIAGNCMKGISELYQAWNWKWNCSES